MRIFAISDLHTDFKENRQLLEQLSGIAYKDDALIVAGDIADRLEVIGDTLSLLSSKFRRVFYVPGNHELWVRNGDGDSLQKFDRIMRLCDQLDVGTRPAKLGDVWVVPLFSWYEESFDAAAADESATLHGWADFHFCKWPDHIGPIAPFFLKMNEPHIREYDVPVVSFSHFLPRRDLLPPSHYLRFRGLPKVSGSAAIEKQVRRLGSVVHVFGHSHIHCDRVIDGVRYVQNALRYPRERSSSGFSVKLIWNAGRPLPGD